MNESVFEIRIRAVNSGHIIATLHTPAIMMS